MTTGLPAFPVSMFDDDGNERIVRSSLAYYQALWEGYELGGPIPPLTRAQIPATLADLDALEVGGLVEDPDDPGIYPIVGADYDPVGVNASSNFPPRIMAALDALYGGALDQSQLDDMVASLIPDTGSETGAALDALYGGALEALALDSATAALVPDLGTATGVALANRYATLASPAFTGTPTVNGAPIGSGAQSQGPILNVKLAPFNAVGDGAADDTTAIQSAIDTLNVISTGGEIYLPSGRYKVSSTLAVTCNSVTIRGAGPGQQAGGTQNAVGTRIEVATGFTGTEVILVAPASGNTPVYGATFYDFAIDGNDVGTGITGIKLRSNRSFVSHVHVHRCTGDGFTLRGWDTTAGDALNWDTYDSVLAFVQAGDCGGSGVLFAPGSADCHLIGAVLFNNAYNIKIAGGASQQITSCHTYDATVDNIKFDGGGSRTKIINCKIEGAGQHGINIDSTNGGYSDLQITGCGLNTNGDSAHNTYDHIMIQGPTSIGITRTTIVGNSFGHKNSVSANHARYGVNISSSVGQGTVVIANSFGPSPAWQPGTTPQIATAAINNASNSSNPQTIRSNAGAADDPIPYVPITEKVNVVAASGATETIPSLQVATIHDVTLTANCTFTFPTPVAGQSFMLLLRQDATGARTATWPASVLWPSGTAPTLSTAPSRVDMLSFVCVSGTSWRGSQPEKYLS